LLQSEGCSCSWQTGKQQQATEEFDVVVEAFILQRKLQRLRLRRRLLLLIIIGVLLFLFLLVVLLVFFLLPKTQAGR